MLHLLTLALLAGAALAAAPASAQTLTPTNNPLPGSNFRGANGIQADAAPLVDWQAMEAAGRVVHNPDPNAEDSAFTGGSKEDEPGEWDLTTEDGGVNPAKDNIRDAWSVVDQPDGNTFLYLGFTREESDGTTFLTFELNRDDRMWNNGRAVIPCRRTGDVLVSYEAHGNEVEVVIRQWVTDEVNDQTDCAETGHLREFTRLTPNVDAQGAMNGASITNYLPGAYGGTIPTERFGEAALNLAKLLDEAFDDECLAFSSIWMHSRSSTSETSNMQDYVAPRGLNIRTCAASGTKFFDRNANGVRDPEDPGIPRFLIWADYDDNGVRDPDEPFSISDNQGQYVIYEIRPPEGTYTLREKVAPRRSRTAPVGIDWRCSYPNNDTDGGTGSAPDGRFQCGWGPIDANATPNATGRDFGNWFPARLTLKKQLEPTTDPGRFDLLVNGEVWFAGAGDGASVTRLVPPGTYEVSEVAVPPTNPAAYDSTVDCRRVNRRRGGRSVGRVFTNLMLLAGQRAVCTFRNIRPGSPAIAIRKVGPDSATAGDVLRYRFYVENIGDVPFAEGDVVVSDPACDEPPELVAKEDPSGEDDSPGTLDPGDVWTYRCSNQTDSPGDDCEPTTVDNTGTVTGTTGGTTVDDDDSISTIIFCPDVPPPPPPEPLDPPVPGEPERPGPVVPPGLSPPNAGDAGVVRALFQRAIRGCIRSRVPRVALEGTRISRVRVLVNGRLVRGLTVRTLRARLRPRVMLAPGRYRIAVRVRFQRGAGTPPLTLRGSFRVCARRSQAPLVTG